MINAIIWNVSLIILTAGAWGFGWHRGWGSGYQEARVSHFQLGYRLGYKHGKIGAEPLHR